MSKQIRLLSNEMERRYTISQLRQLDLQLIKHTLSDQFEDDFKVRFHVHRLTSIGSHNVGNIFPASSVSALIRPGRAKEPLCQHLTRFAQLKMRSHDF